MLVSPPSNSLLHGGREWCASLRCCAILQARAASYRDSICRPGLQLAATWSAQWEGKRQAGLRLFQASPLRSPAAPRMLPLSSGSEKWTRLFWHFPLSSSTHTDRGGWHLINLPAGGGGTIKGPSSVKGIFHLYHICCWKQKAHFWQFIGWISVIYYSRNSYNHPYKS